MATEALKATAVSNLDASPVTRLAPGAGGFAYMRTADGYLTATTGMASGSTYQMVRIPRNAIIKHIWMKLDATVTTFTANVGLYYSTSTTDGTAAANQGAAVVNNCFASAVAYASQNTFTDLMNNVTAANLDKTAWSGVGALTTDPGGYFDVVINLTATSSGGAIVYMEVQYVDPGS